MSLRGRANPWRFSLRRVFDVWGGFERFYFKAVVTLGAAWLWKDQDVQQRLRMGRTNGGFILEGF